MSQDVTIAVQPRQRGKNESRRVRRAGLIPAVVYGGGREPEAVAVDPRPIASLLASERGRNTLIHLRIGDRDLKRMVLIREIQRHPATDRIVHADFVRVELDRHTEVSVPVVLVGAPVGVRSEGGLIEFVHRQVLVRVLPAEIPERIEVDISELHVGQHIEAGELKLPPGVALLTPPTETIATIISKARVEEAAAVAAPAPEAEPTEAAAAGEGEEKTTEAASEEK